MSLLLRISPAHLGLPKQFSTYRPGQAEAIDFALSSDRRFTGLSAPTGIGKSLIGMTVSKALGLKACYLTVTKGLQGQILGDFRSAGLVDVRGRSNYLCRAYINRVTCSKPARRTCEDGAEHGCAYQSSLQCPYFAAYVAASQSELISTNYAYWLHMRRQGTAALGAIELLVCDEAHAAFDQLASFLRVTVNREDYQGVGQLKHSTGRLELVHDLVLAGAGLMSDRVGEAWKAWARHCLDTVQADLAQLIQAHGTLAQARLQAQEEVATLERTIRRLDPLRTMDHNWVWETTAGETTFDPIWVAPYAHQLWSNIPRILLLSATLTPYTLELLGLSPDNYRFQACDNGWPLQNAPVYHLPTVKVNYRNTPEDLATLVSSIDRVISSRLDRKGLIHTVSYERMRAIQDLSLHREQMFSNSNSSSIPETIRRFRASAAPAILISPSFASGWDFPYQQCEYQILPKVPWQPATSRVVQEHLKDPRYRAYCAALETVQMLGRSRRFADDKSETFLLDNHFPWLLAQAKPYLPRRFGFHKITTIPPAPKRCNPNYVKTA